MLDIYENVYELLQQNESFCMATILYKNGSGPRGEGTKMIIKEDLSIIGTIGGGLIEALVIKQCKNLYKNRSSIIKYYNLSNKDASSLGLVCGGEEKVLIEFFDADDAYTKDILGKVKELKDRHEDFAVITRIENEEGKEFYIHGRWICTETDFYGEDNNDIKEISEEVRQDFAKLNMKTRQADGGLYLIEPARNRETVYIFGAGHVSEKLAYLTKMIDMRTVVLDDRSEFANRKRFKDADDIIVTDSAGDIGKYVDIDNQSYIVIVTRGHLFDRVILGQALKTDAKYIGMIGSKNKIRFSYDKLLEEGFSEKDFERVHAPIGLDISAETPEEIAVSIAAEIIKVKRNSLR